MPHFGGASLTRLRVAHPDLQRVLYAAIERIDFSVICSYRARDEQEKACREGRSKAHYGESPHNYAPSLAVDLLPYPFNGWNDRQQFIDLAKVVIECAAELGVSIRWGGDWNRNGEWKDERFSDMPHFELHPWRSHLDKRV